MGRAVEASETKGKEYAPDIDVTDLFKRRAIELDVSPDIIWAVMAGKHWDAIESYCRRGDVLSVESIEGRISDLILYLLLLRSMVDDRSLGYKPTEQNESAD